MSTISTNTTQSINATQSINTKRSFSDKWSKNTALAFAETLDPESDIFQWILTRNGFDSPEALRTFLSTKRRILDAGCGNGRVSALLRAYSDAAETEVVGIDLVAAQVAAENLADQENVRFLEKDLLGDLSDLGKFDFIYCQEVLHHTADPAAAFHNLVERLEEEGRIAIYVYKEKAPAREFIDDYVRGKISKLEYEEAFQACTQITELGRMLSESDATVQVPDVDLLGIEAGEYPVQRFIYHFFAKCFWNPALNFDDNVVINYDWYHPQLATRHTLDEVLGWFDKAGLTVEHEHVDFYGITVRGQR